VGQASERQQITGGDLARQWPVMLAVFLLIGAGLMLYVRSMPVRYTSSSVVAFQPQPGRADGRDLISLLIQTYPEFVVSGQTVEKAALAAGVSASDLQAGLNAEIPPLTLNMLITTELSDPRQAQIANQALVDQVIAQGKADPYLVATPISDASIDESPSGVSKKLLWVVSLMMAVGAALVAGILAARWRVDRSAGVPSSHGN
jgi:hypothetical protein